MFGQIDEDDDDDALVQPCVPKSHSRVPQPSPRLLPDNHHDHSGCDDYDSIKSYDEYIRKSDTPLVGRPTQLIFISDIHLLGWRW